METKPKSFDCFSCNKPHSAEYPTMVCDMCALDFATCFNKLSVVQELSEIAQLTMHYPVIYEDVRESYIYVKLRNPEIEPKALYAIVYLAVQISIKEDSNPYIEVSKNWRDELMSKDVTTYDTDLAKTQEWLENYTGMKKIVIPESVLGTVRLEERGAEYIMPNNRFNNKP